MSRLQLRQLTADRTALFSLPVPSGWSADRSGREGSSVVIFSPTVEDNFRANVNVVVQDLAPLAQEEYLTLSRLQLRKLSNMATLPVDEPFQRLPGGHVFEWVTWEAPIPVRGRQLVAFRDDKAFIVTAMATAGSFERHKPTFDAVLESFSLLQPGIPFHDIADRQTETRPAADLGYSQTIVGASSATREEVPKMRPSLQQEVLEPTPLHRFYIETRQDWVRAPNL